MDTPTILDILVGEVEVLPENAFSAQEYVDKLKEEKGVTITAKHAGDRLKKDERLGWGLFPVNGGSPRLMFWAKEKTIDD